MSEEFRLKKIEKIKNYFIKEIAPNQLISKKHKKVSTILRSSLYTFLLLWMVFL